MKLTENIELNYQILEAKESTDGRLRFGGIFQRSDVKNKNNRIYPKTLWEKVIKSEALREKVKNRQMIGELDHPSDGKGSLKNAALVITKLELQKDGDVYGEAEVLSTSAGKELRALMMDGVMVGISSRGDGTLMKDGVVDESTYELETFDVVGNPSTKGAYPKIMTEEYSPSNAEDQLNKFLMEMTTEDYNFKKMPLDEEVEWVNKFNDRAKLARMYKTENPALTDLCEDVKKKATALRDSLFEDIRAKRMGQRFEETEDTPVAEPPAPPAPVEVPKPTTVKIGLVEVSETPNPGGDITIYNDATVKIKRDGSTGVYFVQDGAKNYIVESYKNYHDILTSFVKEDARLAIKVTSTETHGNATLTEMQVDEVFEEEVVCSKCENFVDGGCKVAKSVIEAHGEEFLTTALANPDTGYDCSFWSENWIEEDVSEEDGINKDMNYESLLDRVDEAAVSEQVNSDLMELLDKTSKEKQDLESRLSNSLSIIEGLMEKIQRRETESKELSTAKSLVNELASKLEEATKANHAAEQVIEGLLAKVQDTVITEEELKPLLREHSNLQPFAYILKKAKDRAELKRMVEDLTPHITEDLPAPPEPRRISVTPKEPLPGDSFRLDEGVAERSSADKRTSERAKTAKSLTARIGGK